MRKQILDGFTVSRGHTSMMNTEPVRHQVFKVRIISRFRLLFENCSTSRISAENLTNGLHLNGFISDILCSLCRLLS